MKEIKAVFKYLYPFEILAAAYAVLAFALIKAYRFNPSYLGAYFFYILFGAVAMMYMMIVLVMARRAVMGFFAKETGSGTIEGRLRAAVAASIESAGKNYFKARFFIYALRMMLSIIAVLLFFCNLKQMIPMVNPALFDRNLWELDTFAHLGCNPTLLGLRLAGNKDLLRLIDLFYPTFAMINIIIPLIFILQRKSPLLRHRLIFAVCLCWIAGGLSYFIFPAMGPCYFKAALFEKLDIPVAKELQKALYYCYMNVRTDPRNYTATNFYGIAAMPSLHIGIITLFTIFSFTLNRILFAALAAYLAIFYAGSILLGWHYAVDDYAGAVLAFLVWYITVKTMK